MLEDFEADGALAGDDHRIIEARHHSGAGLLRDFRGDFLAAVVAPVVEDDFRALAARAVDLHLRGVGRHHDHRGDLEAPGGDRHSARMIARRESDDAALPLFLAELQQAIGCAPQLECAAGLQAFAFEPDADALDPAFDERGSLDQAGDALGGFNHVVTRDIKRFR